MMNNACTRAGKGKGTIFVDSKLSSGTIESNIIVSKSLKKYFRYFHFFSSYDAEITANSSILNIPVLSIVLPLAWITGADVYVDELDKTFAESAQALQQEYGKVYPKAPFNTKLVVDKLVENKGSPNNTALLFSGGVDSTYSLFSNITLRPRLVMIFGIVDIPISNVTFQEKVKTEYSNFARKEGLEINFIRTNGLEILDRSRVNHLWWRFKGQNEVYFYQGIGYMIGQIGQTAPLSNGRFNHLLVGAGNDYTTEYIRKEILDSSSHRTDEKIAWANLRVKHDGALHRYEKALFLKKFINDNGAELRVCWALPEYLLRFNLMNCNKCEKCLRTIAALVYAGIDPNDCGFEVDDSTFYLMRFLIERKLLSLKHLTYLWKPLQQVIPDKIKEDIHGSKKFLEWFKTVDLDSVAKPPSSLSTFLYYNVPYPVSNMLGKIFYESRPNKYTMYEPIELDTLKKNARKAPELK